MKGRVKTINPATRHETGEAHPYGVRGRHRSRKGNRLTARLAAHAEFPVMADGSAPAATKPRARRPGSLNPRKH